MRSLKKKGREEDARCGRACSDKAKTMEKAKLWRSTEKVADEVGTQRHAVRQKNKGTIRQGRKELGEKQKKNNNTRRQGTNTQTNTQKEKDDAKIRTIYEAQKTQKTQVIGDRTDKQTSRKTRLEPRTTSGWCTNGKLSGQTEN